MEGFLGVSAPLTASARALRLSGLTLVSTSREPNFWLTRQGFSEMCEGVWST